MNRRQTDLLVGFLVAVVVVVGTTFSWQAYRQQRALDEMGSMMDVSMGTMHGTNPLWYLLATIVLAGVVGGVYLVVRPDLPGNGGRDRSTTGSVGATLPDADEEMEDERPLEETARQRSRVLDLLPEDERRILEPVLESPGITQIELRDRSNFSKSKVSQTASDLEKRGLLYRERQGRTYRIYPSDDLAED